LKRLFLQNLLLMRQQFNLNQKQFLLTQLLRSLRL